jgi:hypothetical protein
VFICVPFGRAGGAAPAFARLSVALGRIFALPIPVRCEGKIAGVLLGVLLFGLVQGDPAHITVVGAGGTPLALHRIRGGTQDATVEQSPIAMGSFIFDQMFNYFDSKPVEKKGQTKPKRITKANVDEPSNWVNSRSNLSQINRVEARLHPALAHCWLSPDFRIASAI